MKITETKRPLLMGILNVTPDSFSNDGEHFKPEVAIAHATEMVKDGADIIDVGGESTRPGAERVSSEEQIKRVIPVIEAVRENIPENIMISIDTTSAKVAEKALGAGASMLNDVSAGREDPEMFSLVAQKQVPIVLMHMQGQPNTMQAKPSYDDVVKEVCEFLLERAKHAEEAGVQREQIYIDPGIGFGKTLAHNLELIANLGKLVEQPYQVLLGASRKRFMKELCDVEQYNELVGGTCASTSYAVLAGVSIIRVHDVKENRQALNVAYAIREREVGN